MTRFTVHLAAMAAAMVLLIVPASTGAGRAEVRAATLTVASANLWHGGTQVDRGHAKTVTFLRNSGAEVYGLQEVSASQAGDYAADLGWQQYHSGDTAILSRYPIVAGYRAQAGVGARIQLPTGEQAIIWTVHLGYTPYGPYDACYSGMSREQLRAREVSSGRMPQIRDALRIMRLQLARARAGVLPVFLTGDFNAPSHLDWTADTRQQHCGYTMDWPTSVAVKDAGMRDSYREIHPDPTARPGTTWSPIYPRHHGSSGAVEPQDRIDYVHYAGSATPTASRAVVRGTPRPVPEHSQNQWASDHAAVVTEFRLAPQRVPVNG